MSTDIAGVVLVVSVLLSLSSSSPADDYHGLCVTLHVTGALNSATADGLYRFDADASSHSASGRPAWTHVNNTAFLYYLEDGFDGWVISETDFFSWGQFLATWRTDADRPYGGDVDAVWQESINGGEMTPSPTLTVVCVSLVTDNSSVSSSTTEAPVVPRRRPQTATLIASLVCIASLVTIVVAFVLFRQCRRPAHNMFPKAALASSSDDYFSGNSGKRHYKRLDDDNDDASFSGRLLKA